MAGFDRDLLATHMRHKMEKEELSLRKAAHEAGCSAATFSRLMDGSDNEYEPDLATVTAVANWLKKKVTDFDSSNRPPARPWQTWRFTSMHCPIFHPTTLSSS